MDIKQKKLRVGTRGSPLALAQTKALLAELQALHSDLLIELVTITTTGDRIQNRFLSDVGGKGLFVKEIEEAMLAGEIDVAVHSLKDVPAELPKGLCLGCFPKRRTHEDVLISSQGLSLSELPQGARVGTVSLRRRVQLKQTRPDLKLEFLRGNLDTRLKKLDEGQFDAILLAKAGMERLGVSLENARTLSMIPAPGQGTLALECREDDQATLALLKGLQDETTLKVSQAERTVAKFLGGDCHLPLGVLAEFKEEKFTLKLFLSLPDGSEALVLEQSGASDIWQAVVQEMITELGKRGALEIVERCRTWEDA